MWIEELKNGKYRAVERYTDPMTGKQKKISVTIDKNTPATRKAAQKALQAKMECPQQAKSLTLQDVYDHYAVHMQGPDGVRSGTWSTVSSEAVRAIEVIGADVLVDNLTAAYVRERMSQSGKRPETMNTLIKRLKAMLRWAYRSDLISTVAWMDKLECFRTPDVKLKLEDKYLEPKELAALLEAMERSPRWRLLTAFLALSGLRIGEAIALVTADLDEEYIHVTKTYVISTQAIEDAPKTTSSIRDVYIQPELAQVVSQIRSWRLEEQLRRGYRTDILIPSLHGTYIPYHSYLTYLTKISRTVLAHQISPHALRHTHVSLLAAQGVPLDIISRRVGHDGGDITRAIYLHVTERMREKDRQLLSKISIL
ncbi:MAG: site-specific integrase [Blautia sp.]|nr:site-specific integrase [Blautia sp.]